MNKRIADESVSTMNADQEDVSEFDTLKCWWCERAGYMEFAFDDESQFADHSEEWEARYCCTWCGAAWSVFWRVPEGRQRPQAAVCTRVKT
jgi:hypothetical protein